VAGARHNSQRLITSRGTCNHNTRPNRHSGRVIVVQKIKGGGFRGGSRHLGEGKQGFIKYHTAGDDNPVRMKIKASITLRKNSQEKHKEMNEETICVVRWRINWDSRHIQKLEDVHR
jgi:hypothetical protein